MNRQIILNSHPEDVPTLSNFKLGQVLIPQIGSGELLVQALYLSVDPYMRGQLGGRATSHPPFRLNECLWGDGLGKVIESKSNHFQPGDIVAGCLNWSEYSLLNEKDARKLDLSDMPLTVALGPLGMTGLTAYFGFLENAQAKKGETVVVSGAAGAVGTIVGQIAKLQGCRVVGVAGSDEKISVLKNELGFDAAINYRSDQFIEELHAACPAGVDIYFDNVGGMITDQILKSLNKFGRIVFCGQISTYHSSQPDVGIRHFRTLILKSATARGFVVWDYKDRFSQGRDQMDQWLKERKIQWKETIVPGLENAPSAVLGLFSGKNMGKQLVKI